MIAGPTYSSRFRTIAIAVWFGCALVVAPAASAKGDRFSIQRHAMVARIRAQIRRAAPGADDRYLAGALVAVDTVKREAFVPKPLRHQAYTEKPLPIGYEQTISDPYIVTVMTAVLKLPPHAVVLDVGTGSGYQAAVLGRLADRVYSVEIVKPLADSAALRLASLGYANVVVRDGDGYAGWPEHAPFDGIVIAAGAAAVPQPLIDQLKIGGRLVMPVGGSWASEQLLVVTKTGEHASSRCSLGVAIFVPLTGKGARDDKHPELFDSAIETCHEGLPARIYVETLKHQRPGPDRP